MTKSDFNNIDPHYEITKHERITAFLVIALILLLKILYAFRYRFNSDEPQHVHVVWGWVHGLLPYRDMFDNHTPLFHLLCVPFYTMVGDTPSVLFAMRLAMIPLYVIVLWCTYLIGREIFSQRVGLWAALFTGLYPFNFLCSVEFRPDSLWAAIWILAMALIIQGRLKTGKSFWIGFLLGAAIGVSLKTCLLIATLGASAVLTVVFFAEHDWIRHYLRRCSLCAFAMLAGLSIVPVALILFLYSKGALGPFFYQVVDNNLYAFAGFGLRDNFYVRGVIFLFSIACLLCIAQIINKCTPDNGIRCRRIFLLFTAGIYVASLYAFLSVIEWEHYLPLYPLFIILVTPIVLKVLAQGIAHQPGKDLMHYVPRWTFLSVVIFLEMCAIFVVADGAPWHDDTHHQIQLLKDVLQLTEPSDPVADLKGETIFRPRSSYYVLEWITREQIKRGLLTDDIPERLIASHTCVAALDNSRFPKRTRAFLQQNFIRIGCLRVVGQLLSFPENTTPSISFDIKIPARYVIISKGGTTAGLLDDKPYDGARFLTAGHHEVNPSSRDRQFVLLWVRAEERGFSPFLQEKIS
ncbi:MAG: glycosyltransferase family 39 protein [Proteobacteria bacterium]|nr:glycosyltransferase family 39 protein [Pseudomonadota bacterium]